MPDKFTSPIPDPATDPDPRFACICLDLNTIRERERAAAAADGPVVTFRGPVVTVDVPEDIAVRLSKAINRRDDIDASKRTKATRTKTNP
jgi:hypothetical protein